MTSDGRQQEIGGSDDQGSVAELRAQAACCRKLASDTTRKDAAAVLRALADEVELRADALEAEVRPPLR